jgi:hypothetical protein
MPHQRRLAIAVKRRGVHDNDGNGRPLQLPLARLPEGRDTDEEGSAKTTIRMGGGGMVQKWGPNNEYDADDPELVKGTDNAVESRCRSHFVVVGGRRSGSCR